MDKVIKEKINTAHFVFWERIADVISKEDNIGGESFIELYNKVFNEILISHNLEKSGFIYESYIDIICPLHTVTKEFDDDNYGYVDCKVCCSHYKLPYGQGCLGGLMGLFWCAVRANYKVRAWRFAKIIANIVYDMEG